MPKQKKPKSRTAAAALGGSRAYHEEMAVDGLRRARGALVGTGCSMAQVVKAARLVQSARSSIASISPAGRDSARTVRYWKSLGVLERRLTLLVEKCSVR